nr:MAG TPA: hypothetical protein [Caudoviricetes sp.]
MCLFGLGRDNSDFHHIYHLAPDKLSYPVKGCKKHMTKIPPFSI